MTSIRSCSLPARPASRTHLWRVGAAGLLVLAALFLLAGCLAEEGTGASGGGSATWPEAAQSMVSEGCTGCHGPGFDDPDLTSCTVLTNGFLIDPGSPTSSVVYLVANGDLGSPNNSTDMAYGSPSNLATLESWITGGAICP